MGFNYSEFKKTKAQKGQGEKPEAAWVKWVKFGVVTALYLAFLYWVGSWMGLVVVPFIFDAYITKKIPWTWWKNLDGLAHGIMSWVDAIVFALVAVYFVNQFFFQNYKIPSSSLEKSLMTGDYLLVSKLSYGPRIPQTPLTMPLTQHTMPIFGCKSYVEWPQWDYRRVKGLGKVELGDIVVFNFPAGDTCSVNVAKTFYDFCVELAVNDRIEKGVELVDMRELSVQQQRDMYETLYAEGKAIAQANKFHYGEIVSRPADRRENYVKRCVGLPGQTLQIKDKIIYVDGKAEKTPENAQFSYYVYFKDDITDTRYDDLFNELGVSDEQRTEWNYSNANQGRMNLGKTGYMPLTKAAYEGLLAHKELVEKIEEVKDNDFILDSIPYYHYVSGTVYPINHDYGWTRDNYGPIWIPAKGQSIDLTLDNIAIYERPIRTYEGNDLEVKNGKIYINGKEAHKYTFKMDYYWMMGDNRHNSADSRYWGFVPEDHVVGKPLFIWLSMSPDANPSSKVRWNRIFKWVDDIK